MLTSKFKHTHSQNLQLMLDKLAAKEQQQEQKNRQSISKDRELYHEQSMKNSRNNSPQSKPFVCHTTSQSLFETQLKINPYVFMSKAEQSTLITPDRAFAKGKAGKRFIITMKNSSICSFPNRQNQQIRKCIRSEEREKTIISRKHQEYSRLISDSEGKRKAIINAYKLKNKKQFHHSQGSQFFSQCEPIKQIGVTSSCLKKRKLRLSKTMAFEQLWRPFSRGTMTPIGERTCSRHANTALIR